MNGMTWFNAADVYAALNLNPTDVAWLTKVSTRLI